MEFQQLTLVSFKLKNSNTKHEARHSSQEVRGYVSRLHNAMVIYNGVKKEEEGKIQSFISSYKHVDGLLLFDEKLKRKIHPLFPHHTLQAFDISDDDREDVIKIIREYALPAVKASEIVSFQTYKLELKSMINSSLIAKDIMFNGKIVTAKQNAVVYFAWKKMEEKGIGHLPIVENNQLINLISITDLLPYMNEENESEAAETPISKILEGKQKLIFVSENATLETIIKTMQIDQNRFVAMLPVVKDEVSMSLVGLITWVELFKKWPELTANASQDIINTKARDLGKNIKDLMTLKDSNTEFIGIEYLKENRLSLRHIIVTDNTGQISKLIAQRDILKFAPLHNTLAEKIILDNLHLVDVKTQHTLIESTVEHDILLEKVVNTFLQSVLGVDRGYGDRIDGLLSYDSTAKTYLTYITPMDCIKCLLK